MFYLFGVFLTCTGALADQGPRGDPELVALVENEYTSIDEFRDHLSRLEEALIERSDSRAVFAAMYRVLTERVSDAIAENRFRNGEWTAALLVAFGNLYRQAFLDFETGQLERLPEAWRVAFEATQSGDASAFQLGLLGVHAHINHDLPFAIAAVTPHRERLGRFYDYYLTHVFILNSVDAVQEVVVVQFDPALGRLDDALGPLDELVLRQTLTQWRFQAWHRASLFDGSRSPCWEQFYATLLDLITGRSAHRIRGNHSKLMRTSRSGVDHIPTRN